MAARDSHRNDKVRARRRVARVPWNALTGSAVDRVAKGSELIVLERDGKPVAAVVSLEALRLIAEHQGLVDKAPLGIDAVTGNDPMFAPLTGMRCFVVPPGSTKN